MGLVIAKSLLKRLAVDLADNPLVRGEFRPIAKMRDYYISLEPAIDNRRSMLSPEIDGRTYHIYYAPVRLVQPEHRISG